eukprot:11434080-Ditylum_brightwellii.AAC.1
MASLLGPSQIPVVVLKESMSDQIASFTLGFLSCRLFALRAGVAHLLALNFFHATCKQSS